MGAIGSAGQARRARVLAASVCVLLATGVVALLLPGSGPELRLLGREALVAAGLVPVVAGALRVPSAARRSEVPLLVYACAYGAAGLLLIGLAGVLGPSVLAPWGTVVMIAALGPAVLLGCVALLSQGPLLPLRTFLRRRQTAALMAALAAPLALLGLVANSKHDSSGYAMRYGWYTTMKLPNHCEAHVCSEGELQLRNASYVPVKVHFTDEGWKRYSDYYSPFGIGRYKPGGPHDPTGVRLKVWAVDDQAYVAIGYHPDTLAPLGMEPLSWLAWALLPALLIPPWLGYNAWVREKRREDSVRSAPCTISGTVHPPQTSTVGRKTRRPHRLSVSSRHVRVTVRRDGFTVEQALAGPRGGTRWRRHLDMPWTSIARMELANNYRDPVVSLFVHPVSGTRRYALDFSHLPMADWTRVADAVAANSRGRVTLDLSPQRSWRVNPDA